MTASAARLVAALCALLALVAGCIRPTTVGPTPAPPASSSPAATDPVGPSSFELIRAAREAGALSLDAAVLYEAYATFDATRLPRRYRGDPRSPDQGDFAGEVEASWSSLSSSARQAIRPWTLPAYTAGSAWNQPESSTMPAASRAPDASPWCWGHGPELDFSTRWTSVDGPGGFKVWWNRGDSEDEDLARHVAEIAAEARDRTSKALDGLTAPADDGSPCAGGDASFDIVILNLSLGAGQTYPRTSANPTPSYTIIDARTSWRSDDTWLRSILAHELSHSVLLGIAHDWPAADAWFSDGTAVWVQREAYPRAHVEQTTGPDLVQNLDRPLDAPALSGGDRAYATWLFFYDVVRRHHDPGLVAAMYRNRATLGALPSVALALAPSAAAPDRRGLAADWRQFVLDARNKDEHAEWGQWLPTLTYGAWTSAPDSGGPPTAPRPTVVDLAHDHVRTYRLVDTATESLAHLSARYYAFDLAASTTVHAIELRNPYSTGSAGDIRALIMRDGTWTTEDWTGRATVDLCQDHDAERVDQLVLVIGNHDDTRAAPGTPELVARDACDRDFTLTGTHRWTHNAPQDAVPWDTDGDMTFAGDMHCARPDLPPWAGEWTCTGRVTVNGGGTIYAYRVGTSTQPPDCQEPYVVLDLPMRFSGRAPAGPLEKVGLTRDPAGVPKDFKCRTSANATPGLAVDRVYLGGELPLPDIGATLHETFPALDPAFGTPNGQITVTVADKNR
ncbi:hypothetical protein [Cellulomonas sp. URHB0016]